jgi:transmembrane sensor
MDLPINSVEDLLSDEGFLAWYFKTDKVAVEKWNSRIANNPVQKKLTDEAVQLLNSIKIKEQSVDAQRLKNAEERLTKIMATSAEKRPAAKIITMWSRNVKWVAAAAIIFLTSVAVWQLTRTSGKLAIQTAYGETRKDLLPDGSQVMLNANTTIDYKNWKQGTDREVWVKGEAFFHVKKALQKTRFIVHTGNFDVVVTGTQFNVINRPNKNNVYLKEGSVIIRTNGRDIHMNPGDYVEFNNNGVQKKDVNNVPILAWTDHKFIFENTPMNEVASLVTEFYGIKVTLADEAVASSTISGIMPNDNLDVFLQSLEALPEYEITKTDKEILIRKK